MECKFKYPIGTQLMNYEVGFNRIDEIYKYIITNDDIKVILILDSLNDKSSLSEAMPIEELYNNWYVYKKSIGEIEYNFRYDIGDLLKTYEGKYEHYDKLKSYIIKSNGEYASVILDYSEDEEREVSNIFIDDLYDNWEDITQLSKQFKRKRK